MLECRARPLPKQDARLGLADGSCRKRRFSNKLQAILGSSAAAKAGILDKFSTIGSSEFWEVFSVFR
jgi:hypothetical protein